jgi:hypothetical protein
MNVFELNTEARRRHSRQENDYNNMDDVECDEHLQQEAGLSGEEADTVITSEDDLLMGRDFDQEIGSWVYRTLQKVQPGAEITVGSVKVRALIFDCRRWLQNAE